MNRRLPLLLTDPPLRCLERGEPVDVLLRWAGTGGPRNVLIRRANGELTVRPWRGLRKPPV